MLNYNFQKENKKLLKHLLELNRTRDEIARANTHTQRHMNNAWSEMVSSTPCLALYCYAEIGLLRCAPKHLKFLPHVKNIMILMWIFLCQIMRIRKKIMGLWSLQAMRLGPKTEIFVSAPYPNQFGAWYGAYGRLMTHCQCSSQIIPKNPIHHHFQIGKNHWIHLAKTARVLSPQIWASLEQSHPICTFLPSKAPWGPYGPFRG